MEAQPGARLQLPGLDTPPLAVVASPLNAAATLTSLASSATSAKNSDDCSKESNGASSGGEGTVVAASSALSGGNDNETIGSTTILHQAPLMMILDHSPSVPVTPAASSPPGVYHLLLQQPQSQPQPLVACQHYPQQQTQQHSHPSHQHLSHAQQHRLLQLQQQHHQNQRHTQQHYPQQQQQQIAHVHPNLHVHSPADLQQQQQPHQSPHTPHRLQHPQLPSNSSHQIAQFSQSHAAHPLRLQIQPPQAVPEQPLYVNAKQFARILKRRAVRNLLSSEARGLRQRRPYLHESRHKHAMRRPRGADGRFLTKEELEEMMQHSSSPQQQSSAAKRAPINQKSPQSSSLSPLHQQLQLNAPYQVNKQFPFDTTPTTGSGTSQFSEIRVARDSGVGDTSRGTSHSPNTLAVTAQVSATLAIAGDKRGGHNFAPHSNRRKRMRGNNDDDDDPIADADSDHDQHAGKQFSIAGVVPNITAPHVRAYSAAEGDPFLTR